ncbi:MAG TPA: YCF48-related protein [Rhodocyclaceae bacterium]|nr:YCF48-related protein [Rhodocyclaceae bacterium]
MLRQFKKYGSKATRGTTFLSSIAPFGIIGGLLYAGLFVKADAVVRKVDAPAIERRDNYVSLSVPAPQIVWAAGTGGKIVRSIDGGKSWASQPTGIQNNLLGIAAWDPQHATAVGNLGTIIETADGGNTWAEAKTPASSNPNKLFRVHIFDGVAWAVGEFGALLQSKDRGLTWTRALPEKDRAWNDVYFLGQQGWLVGEFGTVMKTSDGGATWAEVATPNKVSLMSVAFRDPQHGVAVGLSGTVMVSGDGGATWRQARQATRESLYSVIWDNDRWLAVGDKGVMVTAAAEAGEWKAARISDQDLSWRTQIVKSETGYYLAGANLAILENGRLAVAGHAGK